IKLRLALLTVARIHPLLLAGGETDEVRDRLGRLLLEQLDDHVAAAGMEQGVAVAGTRGDVRHRAHILCLTLTRTRLGLRGSDWPRHSGPPRTTTGALNDSGPRLLKYSRPGTPASPKAS